MITVAIVEDIEEIREAMSSMVKDAEDMLLVHTFSNAEAALATLQELPVDVVLMDIHLPIMNGIDFIQQLKLKQQQMNFIMCTIFHDDENIFNALKAGASGYLLKGDDPEKIVTAIREVFHGGSPMNAQIARRVIETFQQEKVVPKHSDVQLTKRENELLLFLSKGYRYKEIAAEIFVSIETVRKHINNIYTKLHVQSRMEAVNKVFGSRHSN